MDVLNSVSSPPPLKQNNNANTNVNVGCLTGPEHLRVVGSEVLDERQLQKGGLLHAVDADEVAVHQTAQGLGGQPLDATPPTSRSFCDVFGWHDHLVTAAVVEHPVRVAHWWDRIEI